MININNRILIGNIKCLNSNYEVSMMNKVLAISCANTVKYIGAITVVTLVFSEVYRWDGEWWRLIDPYYSPWIGLSAGVVAFTVGDFFKRKLSQ